MAKLCFQYPFPRTCPRPEADERAATGAGRRAVSTTHAKVSRITAAVSRGEPLEMERVFPEGTESDSDSDSGSRLGSDSGRGSGSGSGIFSGWSWRSAWARALGLGLGLGLGIGLGVWVRVRV